MRVALVPIAVLTGLAAVPVLLAQTVDRFDIQAVKKRSADLADDAQAFVDMVKDRGDHLRDEASVVREQGMANMQRMAKAELPAGPVGAVDFDEIVGGAAANAVAGKGEAPQLIVFASLSMPPKALQLLIRDTALAGGIVVFRGFPENSAKLFAARLGKLVEKEQQLANVGIDPRLFRAFEVQSVPTYVAVSSDFDLCAGFACQTRLPPYDRLIGNVTVDYALESFAQGSGPGARVAAVALSSLRKGRS